MLNFTINAFDNVSHELLYCKLQNYGIRDNTLEWLKHFLTDRTQQVIINGKYSDLAGVMSGVSQGTVLALVLFFVTSMITKQCQLNR